MGIFKRGKVWWINITYEGKRIRRTTETSNKQLAEKIHAKILTQLIEGQWFEVEEGKLRTFEELAEKYEQVFKEQKRGTSLSADSQTRS